jgi:hypothetical protein
MEGLGFGVGDLFVVCSLSFVVGMLEFLREGTLIIMIDYD